jgi:MoxR-like ATPase
MLMSALTGMHCLITGEPGTGKSWSAEVVAKLFFGHLKDHYGRGQGNIGMTATVLIGGLFYNQETGKLEPRMGLLHRYLVLQLDEINRMPPKTQAALLQALMEGSIEIDGIVYPIKLEFAYATANKADAGTFELLKPLGDRFGFSARSVQPDPASRVAIRTGNFVQLADIEPMFRTLEEYRQMVAIVDKYAKAPSGEANEYITKVVDEFRRHDSWFVVPRGNDGEYEPTIGMRAEMALLKGATVRALSQYRVKVLPADVQYVLPAVMSHRLTIKPELRNGDTVRSHIAGTLRKAGLFIDVKE